MRHTKKELPDCEQLIDEVIRSLQPLSPVPITREAGAEMLANLTGFVDALSTIHDKLERGAA